MTELVSLITKGLMAGPGNPAHCCAPFKSTNASQYLLCARQARHGMLTQLELSLISRSPRSNTERP